MKLFGTSNINDNAFYQKYNGKNMATTYVKYFTKIANFTLLFFQFHEYQNLYFSRKELLQKGNNTNYYSWFGGGAGGNEIFVWLLNQFMLIL